MRMIEAHAVVGADGTLTLQMPPEVAPGKYYVHVLMCNTPIDDHTDDSPELSVMIEYCLTSITLIRDGNATTVFRSDAFSGFSLCKAFIDYVKSHLNLLIGERTAESAILELGSAALLNTEFVKVIRGRDLTTGLPKAVDINGKDIWNAIEHVIETFVDRIVVDIEHNISAELRTEIAASHIVLRGKFCSFRKLAQALQEATGRPVRVEE